MQRALRELRGSSDAAVREAALDNARRLTREAEALLDLQRRMLDASGAAIDDALLREGLDRGVLSLHPEHLAPIVRRAIERAAVRAQLMTEDD